MNNNPSVAFDDAGSPKTSGSSSAPLEVKHSDVSPLPALRQIFDEAKVGRHWAFGDDVYPEISSPHFGAYAAWFARIGIQLHGDPRGFYYATLDKDDDATAPNTPVNKTTSNLVLFAAIWIESLADRGLNFHAEIFEKNHRTENLPHLNTEAHRRLMTEMELGTTEAINRFVSTTMARLGFAQVLSDDAFCIRTPFLRILDICQEYGRTDATKTAASSIQPPAQTQE